MSNGLSYSSTLKFYANLDEIVPDFKIPPLQDYTDKVILPPSVLDSIVAQQSHLGLNSLPSPLVFKISTPAGKACYVGVREFSSVEDYVILPRIVQEKLEIDGSVEAVNIGITLETEIPRGSALVLKPMNPDYPVQDWKFFLEAKLTSAYTTLTAGEILHVWDKEDQVYKLLVDEVQPERTVLIVNTDLDLSIAPLNDEFAQTMLDNRSKAAEIVELTESKTVTNLDVRYGALKFRLAAHGSPVVVQLLAKDPEFDTAFIDLFASTDASVSERAFKWSTLDASITVRQKGVVQLTVDLAEETPLFVVPFLWTQKTVFEVKVVDPVEAIVAGPESVSQLGAEEARCANCGSVVSKQSLFLHENFCLRNNVKCPQGCGRIFHRAIPSGHWHCDLCTAYGDSAETREHHVALFHEARRCECGEELANYERLGVHRDTACELKLHECRFCHLTVARGKSTAMDEFLQLSHHENECGSKTVDCSKCGKPILLRALESHMKLHEIDRVSRAEPAKCANVNCVRTRNLNGLGLCDVCYGPSYSTVHDPTNARLQARLERRYVIQLTRGCGNSWCKNPSCKTSGLAKLSSMGEVMRYVKEVLLMSVPNIPLTAGNLGLKPEFQLCVDSSMTKKRLLAEWLYEEGEYSYNWCCEALNHVGDEQGAKRWLQENGVRRTEADNGVHVHDI